MNKLPVAASGAGNVAYNLSSPSARSRQPGEFAEACEQHSLAQSAVKKRDPVIFKIKMRTAQ